MVLVVTHEVKQQRCPLCGVPMVIVGVEQSVVVNGGVTKGLRFRCKCDMGPPSVDPTAGLPLEVPDGKSKPEQ